MLAFNHQDIVVPGKSTLYLYRVDLDLASMLFARRHRFALATPWYCHCRCDSSPQFGRDYFMSECDLFYPAGVNSWEDVSGDGILVTRLLVGQTVGSRAAGVAAKTRKLLHQLQLATRFRFIFRTICSCHCSWYLQDLPSLCFDMFCHICWLQEDVPKIKCMGHNPNKQFLLVFTGGRERERETVTPSPKESETISGTLSRCLSLVFDWGAESGVWKAPSSFVKEALPWDTLFGMALPIPDHDHSLHHVPCQIRNSCSILGGHAAYSCFTRLDYNLQASWMMLQNSQLRLWSAWSHISTGMPISSRVCTRFRYFSPTLDGATVSSRSASSRTSGSQNLVWVGTSSIYKTCLAWYIVWINGTLPIYSIN